ncbi:MAG: hypothetical protein ACT4PT_05240 [Methanobacteriota archaeon]
MTRPQVSLVLVALAMLSPAVLAGVNSITGTASGPAAGRDVHDSLESQPDTGTVDGNCIYDYTVPNVPAGTVVSFFCSLRRTAGVSRVVSDGCSGFAQGLPPTPPHQFALSGWRNDGPSTDFECRVDVAVGSLLGTFVPGSHWAVRASAAVSLDWECFGNDPLVPPFATCDETWRASSRHGGTPDSHTVRIAYSALGLGPAS